MRALRVRLTDREHTDLDGGEPERVRAGVVLDQDADEPLHRAEERAVDHRRRLLLVVRRLVGEPEALRHHEVELDGAELPAPPERVLHVDVDLRPVEGALARHLDELDGAAPKRAAQRPLGDVPLGVRAELVVRAQRELDVHRQVEQPVEIEGMVEAAEDLVLDLVVRTEDMAVVLRDMPNSQQAVQGAGRLVAMERPRLGEAHRELAIAAAAGVVDETVPRAVHRLQPEEVLVPRLLLDEEHVVPELLPVT